MNERYGDFLKGVGSSGQRRCHGYVGRGQNTLQGLALPPRS
jgi:hypothetical protein